jgi:hypothetical protein
MKILVIADRPPTKPIGETVRDEQPDLIITLGDLELSDLQGLDLITNIPKIGVYGNHCSGNYFNDFGIEDMHLKIKEIGGVVFGGFEGSVRYKNGDAPMYTQQEAAELLKDFPHVDVMLAHSPVRGLHDENDPAHQGFDALRTYVTEKKPKYYLHGHTYVSSSTKVDVLESTQVVHVYADQVMVLDVA